MEAVKIEGAPKVEVQGVPGAYNTTAQQSQVVPTPNQESQNGLDEFLTFENAKPNGVKQEQVDEMETEQSGTVETVETTEEENVDVVFEVNGQKINACMSASMAQMLKDSEEMRLQVIDRIMAEAGNNPDQPVTVTAAEPSSRDTSATESADSPTIKTEPGTPYSSTTSPRLNGQTSLGKRPLSAVIAPGRKNVFPSKVVTRGSVGIIKPKFEPKFVTTPIIKTHMTQKKVAGPFVGKPFIWDHKAIVSLIECYKNVNDRITVMGATRNIDLWSIVGKRMRARGFSVSDIECQSKFSTLTVTNQNSIKMKKKDSVPGKNSSWEYYRSMENALMDASPAGKAKPLIKTNPSPKPRAIPVITLEDDSPTASDGEGLEDDEDSADPIAKKAKTDGETSAIDKFRRTYLRVETEKLKEMKAARALQQEQSKLMKERNEILNTIATLLGNKK